MQTANVDMVCVVRLQRQSMTAFGQNNSWYQVLPQGFGNRVGAIANAKLHLCLLQMATYCLFTEIKGLGNITALGARRRQSQNGQFAGR